MFWHIVKKEILDSLMSLRLTLAFLLVILLMITSGFLFHGEYERQLSDYSDEVSRNLAQLAERASRPMPLFQAFSWSYQFIYRRPNPLGFIAEGHDKDLPNGFQVNAFRLEGPEYTLRGNPLLWRFDTLDWAFIVSVILSFAAIVLVYDSLSGEKEQGTLRLVMSHPVSRDKILLAKYLSAMIVLFIPLAAGVLINLLIITLQGTVRLDQVSWLRIGFVFMLCLVYISAFVMVGLFISARTKESVISLVISLLVWVLFVIVIPASGSLSVKGLMKLPMQERVLEDAARAAEEALQNYNQRHPHPNNWIISGHWSPGEPLLRAFEVDEARGRVIEDYRNRMIAQVELGQKIARLSPTASFTHATESIVESGLFHYEAFLKQARRYREALKIFLDQSYPLDKVHPLDRAATDPVVQKMKLNFDSIPKFEDRFVSSQEAVSQALWDVGGLALFNLILFGAAYVSFIKYDVR